MKTRNDRLREQLQASKEQTNYTPHNIQSSQEPLKQTEFIEIEDIKKIWVGYILWTIGLHYLYYNKFITWFLFASLPIFGYVMGFLLSFLAESLIPMFIGFGMIALFVIWWIVDLFRIPRMTKQENKRLAIKKFQSRIYIK